MRQDERRGCTYIQSGWGCERREVLILHVDLDLLLSYRERALVAALVTSDVIDILHTNGNPAQRAAAKRFSSRVSRVVVTTSSN
jgi:hypothetical protein